MKFGTLCGSGKMRIEQANQLSRFCSMEVGNRALLFFVVCALWHRAVEDERENSIEESGTGIHRADVLVHRQFPSAQTDSLFGRVKKNAGEAAERPFLT